MFQNFDHFSCLFHPLSSSVRSVCVLYSPLSSFCIHYLKGVETDSRGSKCWGFESTPCDSSEGVLESSTCPDCDSPMLFIVSGVEYVSGLQRGSRLSWSLLFSGTLLLHTPLPRHSNCLCSSWGCHWFPSPSKYEPTGTCVPSFNRRTKYTY